MPIYEYQCLSKGHRFEELQKVSDAPLSTCKICGGEVKKLISATSFMLKGGGWYRDGYGNGNGNGSSSKKSEESGNACSGCPSKCENQTKESS